ncbi:MAG: hypothetical protein ABL883_04130 [Terricaulis sp.]
MFVTALIQAVGTWFLVAVALEFTACYSEQMAAAWKPLEGEEKRGEGFGAFALMVVTTLTPAMLFVHAFFTTASNFDALLWSQVRIWALALIVAAILVGAIAGRLLGSAWQGGARIARVLALPLGLAAFVFTIYATRPALEALVDALSGEVIALPVRPY